jgi:hypothetical protein
MAMAMTEARPAWLLQAVMAMAMTASVSEPETALPRRLDQQVAWAALRRPQCVTPG